MSTQLIISIIALILACVACIACIVFAVRLKRLTRGNSGANFEAIITSLDADVQKLFTTEDVLSKKITELQAKIKGAIRKTGVVKFNALPDLGGNQSFALALLNEEKCGYVITHLAVRDRIQIFTKNITNGTCDQDLSEEEESAIDAALKN